MKTEIRDEAGRVLGYEQPTPMPQVPYYRVVCAWCEKVMEEGAPGALISHGICQDCFDQIS